MKHFFRLTLVSFVALFIHAVSAQAPNTVKDGITRLDPPQPVDNDGKIEVLEFFGYGCIHCANFEPALETWVKNLPADVKFKRVPAGFMTGGVDDIPIYYTLDAMGLIDKMQKKIFEAIFNDRVMIGHKPTFLKWLEKQGVDPAKYESVERSFSVQSKIMRGRGLASAYKITATPMMVVNGRFLVEQVSGSMPFLANIDRLVAEARATAAKSNAVSAPAKPAPAKAVKAVKAAAPAPAAQ